MNIFFQINFISKKLKSLEIRENVQFFFNAAIFFFYFFGIQMASLIEYFEFGSYILGLLLNIRTRNNVRMRIMNKCEIHSYTLISCGCITVYWVDIACIEQCTHNLKCNLYVHISWEFCIIFTHLCKLCLRFHIHAFP